MRATVVLPDPDCRRWPGIDPPGPRRTRHRPRRGRRRSSFTCQARPVVLSMDRSSYERIARRSSSAFRAVKRPPCRDRRVFRWVTFPQLSLTGRLLGTYSTPPTPSEPSVRTPLLTCENRSAPKRADHGPGCTSTSEPDTASDPWLCYRSRARVRKDSEDPPTHAVGGSSAFRAFSGRVDSARPPTGRGGRFESSRPARGRCPRSAAAPGTYPRQAPVSRSSG